MNSSYKNQLVNDKPPDYSTTVYKNSSYRPAESEFSTTVLDHEVDYDQLVEDMNAKDIVEHENYVKKQINTNYPITYIIIDSAIMIILNVVLIILQIVATQNNAALSYLGSAIWAGTYNLITVLLVLLTLKCRNSTLVMITSTLKLFGMIISFVGFILVNLVAFYHYNCMAVSYYRPCYNKDMMPIHYAITGVGIPCVVLSVVFFLYFQFKILARHKFVRPQQLRNSQNFDLTFAVSM